MGAVLSKPILSKVVERSGNSFLNCASASVNGFRPSMEDAHMNIMEERVGYFGVFDGHSSEKCSQFVAAQLPNKLKALKEPITAEMLESVCVQIDQTFIEHNSDSGSTGTFCIVRDDGRVTIANVGDSRILVQRNGKLIFETKDHKPYDPSERARIMRCGGSVINRRVDGDLAVSRAFGDAMFKDVNSRDYRNQKVIVVPDVSEVQCYPGDVIIICCDGVFECLESLEVVKYVNKQLNQCWDDLAVVACRVCDEAIRKGSRDNISCFIVRLEEGKSKVQKFGAKSFVPGPPFFFNDEASRIAYTKMAEISHISCPEALRLRYQLLQLHDRNQLHDQPPVMRTAFEMSDEVDVERERSFFRPGPAPGNEKAFFEALVQSNDT